VLLQHPSIKIAPVHGCFKPAGFRSISKKVATAASGPSWRNFAGLLVAAARDSSCRHDIPGRYRYAAPVGVVLQGSPLGFFVHWSASWMPGNPVLWLCMLGGIESITEHAVGIHWFEILRIRSSPARTPRICFCPFLVNMFYGNAALALAAGDNRWLHSTYRTGRNFQPA
jgi:hypothetical protein